MPNIGPLADEIEVSVFGPGYGECIVIHIGYNQWIIIDSCVHPDTKEPAALKHFREIGVDPSSSVAFVMASHWHDDHVRGLSKIVAACSNAKFGCSIALKSDEFTALTKLYSKAPTPAPTGVREFGDIVEVLEKRKLAHPENPGPTFAVADRPIWHRSDNHHKVTVTSLSPSDKSVQQAYSEISKAFTATIAAGTLTVMSSVHTVTPNNVAVVLWIEIGPDLCLLLGSDLEETNNPYTGWSVIVNSKTRPPGKASIFKVPHHGSATAHSDLVWKKMLSATPIAVLTPFKRGNKSLPQQSDKQRIASLATAAYLTSSANPARIKRAPKVERMVKGTVRSISANSIPVGHVRYRIKIGQPLTNGKVDLFSGAVRL